MQVSIYSKEIKKCPSKYGIFYGPIWGRRKKIKERLLADFGKCFWCNTPVKTYPHKEGESQKDDLATLDHLKSKNAGRKVGELTPKVLSCYKCNEERAQKEILNNRIRELNEIHRRTNASTDKRELQLS